jgi:predicted GNAT family acetyltransferase
MQMDVKVTDNPAARRFELPLGGDDVAAIYYRGDPEGRLVLLHTEVPSEHSGQGHATRLAIGALDLIRDTGRKAIFRCPFLSNFLSRHPEYADLVAG